MERIIPNPEARLLDRIREVIRLKIGFDRLTLGSLAVKFV